MGPAVCRVPPSSPCHLCRGPPVSTLPPRSQPGFPPCLGQADLGWCLPSPDQDGSCRASNPTGSFHCLLLASGGWPGVKGRDHLGHVHRGHLCSPAAKKLRVSTELLTVNFAFVGVLPACGLVGDLGKPHRDETRVLPKVLGRHWPTAAILPSSTWIQIWAPGKHLERPLKPPVRARIFEGALGFAQSIPRRRILLL